MEVHMPDFPNELRSLWISIQISDEQPAVDSWFFNMLDFHIAKQQMSKWEFVYSSVRSVSDTTH